MGFYSHIKASNDTNPNQSGILFNFPLLAETPSLTDAEQQIPNGIICPAVRLLCPSSLRCSMYLHQQMDLWEAFRGKLQNSEPEMIDLLTHPSPNTWSVRTDIWRVPVCGRCAGGAKWRDVRAAGCSEAPEEAGVGKLNGADLIKSPAESGSDPLLSNNRTVCRVSQSLIHTGNSQSPSKAECEN